MFLSVVCRQCEPGRVRTPPGQLGFNHFHPGVFALGRGDSFSKKEIADLQPSQRVMVRYIMSLYIGYFGQSPKWLSGQKSTISSFSFCVLTYTSPDLCLVSRSCRSHCISFFSFPPKNLFFSASDTVYDEV